MSEARKKREQQKLAASNGWVIDHHNHGAEAGGQVSLLVV